MAALLPLLALPFLLLLILRYVFRSTFGVLEFIVLEVILSATIGVGFLCARANATADVEVWSGRITEKIHDSQSCCHCREVCQTCTRTVPDGNGGTKTESYECNCHQVCDHSRDYFWALEVSTGDRISIEDCEPDEDDVPEAWEKAKVGDPAAVEHSYTNYLLADENALLRQATADESLKAPPYPRVYRHYFINRAISVGTKMDTDTWNEALMRLNADLGAKKQVNIIVIGVKHESPTWADVIERDWLYGKKNDLIFVLGAPDGMTVTWARVVTISRVPMLQVTARDTLIGQDIRQPESTLPQLRGLVEKHFQRTPMKEWEYLAAAARPSKTAMFLLYAVGIIGSLIGTAVMVHHDFFGEDRIRRRR